MTIEQVIKQLKQYVDAHGSQLAAAKSIDCTPPYLNDVLRGKRSPGPKILKALGLQKGYFKVKT